MLINLLPAFSYRSLSATAGIWHFSLLFFCPLAGGLSISVISLQMHNSSQEWAGDLLLYNFLSLHFFIMLYTVILRKCLTSHKLLDSGPLISQRDILRATDRKGRPCIMLVFIRSRESSITCSLCTLTGSLCCTLTGNRYQSQDFNGAIPGSYCRPITTHRVRMYGGNAQIIMKLNKWIWN